MIRRHSDVLIKIIINLFFKKYEEIDEFRRELTSNKNEL